MAAKRPRKTAEDWMRAGFGALAREGVAGVKVERLAKQMGVTKGSFYWHFADRRALLTAMLAWWEQFGTTQIIEQVDAAAAEPQARLHALAFATMKDTEAYDHIEAALRQWAATDEAAQTVIERVDATRLAYVRDLLIGTGMPADQAMIRAQLLYRVMIGEYTWRSHGGPALTDAALADLVALIGGPVA
jgi:AcrR family transcriptional regulator